MVAYFTKQSTLTFTKLHSVRRHLFKMVLVLLFTTFLLFTVASSVADFYTVALKCNKTSLDITATTTNSIILKRKLTFGVSAVCIKNTTTRKTTCSNLATLNIIGNIPLDETKKLLILVIVFNVFAFLSCSSTTYCSIGLTKTVGIYMSISFMVFSVICATYGIQEAFLHFHINVLSALQNFFDDDSLTNCSITEIVNGHCYRTTVAATVLLYVTLLLYLCEWKFPRKVEMTPSERVKHYRLMSHISGQSVIL